MTLTDDRPASLPGEQLPSDDLTRSNLDGWPMVGIALGAIVVAAMTWIPFGSVNWARWLIASVVFYIVAVAIIARIVESPRQATDRVATSIMTCAFCLVLLPLVSVIWTVVSRGANRFDAQFFTENMRNVIGEGGGGQQAIIGTLMITGLAAMLSIPFGLFTAIYLVEYSTGNRFSRVVTGLVDVMTGIPSIVAGLFALAVFTLIHGPGHVSALSGAVALTLLMTPVVVRTCEEMLRLVPNELREASYALGVPKWKTIVKVVLPTAIAGILTGVVLAVARVIGETAPLLVTVGITDSVNLNPFDGRVSTLPVFTYLSYKFPDSSHTTDRAWAAALTLVVIVMVLFSAARILSHILKPKGLK